MGGVEIQPVGTTNPVSFLFGTLDIICLNQIILKLSRNSGSAQAVALIEIGRASSNIMLSALRSSIVCRRCCRPALVSASLKNSTGGERIVVTPYTTSSIPTVVTPPPSRALSTISFDAAAAYFSNSPTSPSLPVENNNLAVTTTTFCLEHQHYSCQQAEEQIKKWIENNPLIAPYKAEESLAKLWVAQQEIFVEWAASSSPPILITTNTVNLCIKAWCHSNKGEIAAERAERLLNWMENLHDGPSTTTTTTTTTLSSSSSPLFASLLPQPNYQSYALAIDAWSQAAVIESSKGSAATSNTNSKAIPDATNVGFNCAKRAEELLMRMQAKHEELQHLSETNRDYPYNSELQPDTNVFNTVLMAWAHIRGGTKASATRAMRILDLMQELHHHQSSDAPSWQGIGLSKVQPNLHTYKCVIYAWGHAAHTLEGPDRAELILRHMLSLSKAGNNSDKEVLPDEECFHIVMKAHAELIRRRGKGDNERARQVTDLLNWMELLACRRTKPKIEPTTESYRIALSAWAWSHHIDAPKEAEEILFRLIRACELNRNKMKDIENGLGSKDSVTLAVTPETKDFNTVINTCAFKRGVGLPKDELDDDVKLNQQLALKETYDIAEGVLDALLSFPYAQPDSATFAGMIRSCVNLLPDTDDRDLRVIDIFRLAYQIPNSAAKSSVIPERLQVPPGGGCVDANVLRQLRHALPTEEYIRVREEFEEHRLKNIR